MTLITPEVERVCRDWLENIDDTIAREKMEREIFLGEKSDKKTGAFVHLYTHEWLSKAGYTLEFPEPPDLLAFWNSEPEFYVETTHRGPSAVVDGHWDSELWIDETKKKEPTAVSIPDRNVVLECLRKKQNKYTDLNLPLLLVCGIAYRPYDKTEAEDDLFLWKEELLSTQTGEAKFQSQFSGFLFAYPLSPYIWIDPLKAWFCHHEHAKHPLDSHFFDIVKSFPLRIKDIHDYDHI